MNPVLAIQQSTLNLAAACKEARVVLDENVTKLSDSPLTGYVMSTLNILRMLNKQLRDLNDAL